VVNVVADVAADGRPGGAEVISEYPSGQGFGDAMRRCFRLLRFAPALDVDGRATSARLRLRFLFVR
jgi:hypothetical protein